MLTVLAGWLAKVGIGTIVSKLAAAYEARENAKTSREKLAADARVKALEARRDVLVAEGQTPVNAFMRAALALPIVIYNAKIIVWDKVLGWGVTDPLSDEMTWTARVVIGFYFLYEGARLYGRRS